LHHRLHHRVREEEGLLMREGRVRWIIWRDVSSPAGSKIEVQTQQKYSLRSSVTKTGESASGEMKDWRERICIT
jgi:hypothetical protein